MASNDILTQAAQACVDHARALFESARTVQSIGHPNIAYHLAVLALEELGRRVLIVQSIVYQPTPPPARLGKQMQNHVKKLFWCFFDRDFFENKPTPKALDSIQMLAKKLHERRLVGLYVEQDGDELTIPSNTIQTDECEQILELVEARLQIAVNEKLRDNITEEERSLHSWFLQSVDDLEKQQFILSSCSMAKLAELKNGQEWIHWLKSEIEKVQAESIRLTQMELERSLNSESRGEQNKWKIRIRLYSGSHTVRQKELTQWNKTVEWIKLEAVSGKKNQLFVEFILPDNIPLQALWDFALGLARCFVAALNIGTMGFWWWQLPEQIDQYYEHIEDLERKSKVQIKRSPSLKIDWGENRVLTAEDLARVSLCFTALPEPNEQQKHTPFNYYIGGLTFLSLNDIHWQCESYIFGNFFKCLKAMMAETGDWQEKEGSFESVLEEYVCKLFPARDEDIDKFFMLARAFEASSTESATITLREASFAKVFCDHYFLSHFSLLARAKRGLPS